MVASLASSVSEIARARTRDAEDRRREADLAAEMATLLLGAQSLAQTLPTAAARLAHTLSLNSAAIETEAVAGDERTVAFPLRDGTRTLGTLLVGADSSQESLRRLRERVVPSLQALLGAALERERLLAGTVEAAALRRADNVKTALLRSVSHDLRSPLTAISAASDALGSATLSPEERADMTAVIGLESRRLSRLVDNLLELSRLQAGAAEPRREFCSVDELLGEAVHQLGGGERDFSLSIDPELPLLSIDPVQMERAFVNVLDNARRHSGGHPVSVRARAVRSLSGPTPPGHRPSPPPRRPRDRARGGSRPRDPARAAGAGLRALLPRRPPRRRARRIGTRACDRARLHRSQRRDAARRVAAGPGLELRVRAAARAGRRAGRARGRGQRRRHRRRGVPHRGVADGAPLPAGGRPPV